MYVFQKQYIHVEPYCIYFAPCISLQVFLFEIY